ncbi:class I SAM-dependent methyltransferase [Pseudomarimonas arenosa]|uniref:Class I SAM-dependent methyltransferase n=1 Tax=Pseudomarimonas arenosa TaxID=2774145 RepID=A0AAW3ZP78_9GAMM|nr:class I SAM-dependent methyltransferase [Pseudomarimonas arenosa]MBD8527970.1 hypothetical protein [Pseudomarimonas arenosa]
MPSTLSLLLRSLVAWGAAAAVLLAWAWSGSPLGGWLGGLLLAVSGSALLSRWLGLPIWWVAINALMPLLVILALRSQAAPGIWLMLGLAMLLLFGASFQSRVPLWLSGARVRRALPSLLPQRPQGCFLDLGAGLAGPAMAVQRARPGWRVDATEWAPLPYLIGALRLRLAGLPVRWRRRDLWQIDLADYDVVYAYLSPAPMSKLWAKCCQEMRPGSLLISYRFAVPQQLPSQTIELGRNGDVLLVYRL